jgi:hypothetical protein
LGRDALLSKRAAGLFGERLQASRLERGLVDLEHQVGTPTQVQP